MTDTNDIFFQCAIHTELVILFPSQVAPVAMAKLKGRIQLKIEKPAMAK